MVAATAGGTPRPNFPARPKLSARRRLRSRPGTGTASGGAAEPPGAAGRGLGSGVRAGGGRATRQKTLRGRAEPQSQRWGCVPAAAGRGRRPPALQPAWAGDTRARSGSKCVCAGSAGRAVRCPRAAAAAEK